MISPENAEEIILKALNNLNEERPENRQINVGPNTALFGGSSELDSLSLVSVISDVETELNLRHQLSVSLADDKAMNREVFPFSDVQTLKAYIVEVAAEQ